MAQLKDLSHTYSSMRLVAISSVVSALIAILSAFGFGIYAFNSVGSRVYVVGQSGTTQMALADSPENHTQFEMRNLVRTFVVNMFGHDQYTFKDNLNTALPLIDDVGGRRIYADFKRQEILANYVKFGARTTVSIDSIKLDASKLPVRGQVYFRQTGFIGDRQSKPKTLGCSFELTNTYRSERDSFGMMLTHFDYFPYNPGETDAEKRLLQKQAERDAQELADAKAAVEAARAGAVR